MPGAVILTTMGDVVNLRLARKAKMRTQAAADAAAQRALHGRTKADKRLMRDERARLDRVLDGAAIVPPDDGDATS